MPCFHPQKAWKSILTQSNGKHHIKFPPRNSGGIYSNTLPLGYSHTQFPCGQCRGCRLDRSRDWAIRCTHEASLYENNCFITLTYNEESLPDDQSLRYKDFQNFLKYLRRDHGSGIRFYMCGEYGENMGRPHYHACIFNYNFPDQVFYKKDNGVPLYTSEILTKLWGKGYATVGNVTFESAAYVARYILKKINGAMAEDHYQITHPKTGCPQEIIPEFTNMSRKPGIAKGWFDLYKDQTYDHDNVVLKGRELKIPKYYDNLYEIDHPEYLKHLKQKRKEKAKLQAADLTPNRLLVREKVCEIKTKALLRNYENDT